MLSRRAATANVTRGARVRDSGVADRYTAWLKNGINLREIADWVDHNAEITRPYFDRHNNQLGIYARRENGHFLLTDDGHTMQDLESAGCI
jgi:hypothetical protein